MVRADRIEALRREIEVGGARPEVIDAAVDELLADGDEHLPAELLLLLSDAAQYDEGMFSLIHAAESVDDRSYVRALLAVLPELSASAPGWAAVVLGRMLNNPATHAELGRRLGTAPAAVKEVVRQMRTRRTPGAP